MVSKRFIGCVVRAVGAVLLIALAATPLRAIDPLPEDLMMQVRTARDLTERFDEPAIGPLLSDAVKWKAGDMTGAMIPDYATLRANPGKYRGQLFLIDGLFAGAPKPADLEAPKVGIAGPWDGKAQRWTVVVDEARDEVVIVLLTDPPKNTPVGGTHVRMPGRLYKVWSYKDLNNHDQSALVFVGKAAEVVEAAPSVKKSDPTVIALTVAAFAGLCVLIYFYRSARKRNLEQGKMDYRERLRQHGGGGEELPYAPAERVKEEPLPKDPVEALKELERRAGEK